MLCPNVERFTTQQCRIATVDVFLTHSRRMLVPTPPSLPPAAPSLPVPPSAAWPAAPAAASPPPAAQQQQERHAQQPAAPAAAAPAVLCRRLRRVDLGLRSDALFAAPQLLAAHVRESLAALPALARLTSDALHWAAPPQRSWTDEAPLISATATRLDFHVNGHLVDSTAFLCRLPDQFPRLRHLHAGGCLELTDAGLDVALGAGYTAAPGKPFGVHGFRLKRDHAARGGSWPWPELAVAHLDVASFARLPLGAVRAVSWSATELGVGASADAGAVARVAAALARWGVARKPGGGDGGRGPRLTFGGDCAALAATVGPVLAAAPPERRARLALFRVAGATPEGVRLLGRGVPPSVRVVALQDVKMPAAAVAALLPSLPDTVAEVRLSRYCFASPPAHDDGRGEGGGVLEQSDNEEDDEEEEDEEVIRALCGGAVRPIKVVVCQSLRLGSAAVEELRGWLAEEGLAGLVTLAEGSDINDLC